MVLLVDSLGSLAGSAEFDEAEVDPVLVLEGDLHDRAILGEEGPQIVLGALGEAKRTSELRLET